MFNDDLPISPAASQLAPKHRAQAQPKKFRVISCRKPCGAQVIEDDISGTDSPNSNAASPLSLSTAPAAATFSDRAAQENRPATPIPSARLDLNLTEQKSIVAQESKERVQQRMQDVVAAITYSRSQWIAILKRLVTEAARYQRSFYDHQRAPTQKLRRFHRWHVPTFRKPRAKKSYMMLDALSLRNLLEDIDLLLDPTLSIDRTADVIQQIHQLNLFQPSGFPCDSE